jgi:hypothetical protein
MTEFVQQMHEAAEKAMSELASSEDPKLQRLSDLLAYWIGLAQGTASRLASLEAVVVASAAEIKRMRATITDQAEYIAALETEMDLH